MKSEAATVDDFLNDQSDATRGALEQLRRLVRTEAPTAVEGMRDGGPVYTLPDGPLLCGFTAQKHDLAFYVGRVPDELRELLGDEGFSVGKEAVRFRKLSDGKLEGIRTLLRQVIAEGITG